MKKLCVLISIVAITAMLTGCYSQEEKQYMEGLEKQAEVNSVAYIKNKYGISAEVVKSECEKQKVDVVPNFSPPPTGNVYVTLSYNGDVFHVLISGKDVADEGYDDYQYKDIEEYIKSAIEESISEDILNLYMEYGLETSRYNHFVNEYFDGTNIQDIFKDGNIREMVISYVGEDSSTKDISSLVREHSIVTLVNYRDERSYELLSEKERRFYYYEIEKAALAIRDYTRYYGTEIEYGKYDLQEWDDIYYVTKGGTYCDIIESEIDSPSNFDERGKKNPYQLTKAYRIYTDASVVYVFAEQDKLEEKGGYFVLQYKDNGHTKYSNAYTSYAFDGKFITASIPTDKYHNAIVCVLADR